MQFPKQQITSQTRPKIQVRTLKSNHTTNYEIIDNNDYSHFKQQKQNQTGQVYQYSNPQRASNQQMNRNIITNNIIQNNNYSHLINNTPQYSYSKQNSYQESQYTQKQSQIQQNNYSESQLKSQERSQKKECGLVMKTQTYKGLIGFNNIGNTCFLNSILQCLINSPYFSMFFLKEYKSQLNSKEREIAKEFSQIVQFAHNNNDYRKSINTYNLKKVVGIFQKKQQIFQGYDQHDAQEFLKALLEGLHDDLNRVIHKKKYQELKVDPKNLQVSSEQWKQYYKGFDDSIITDLFEGQLMSEIQCGYCNYKSYAFDNFWDLSLSFTRGLKMVTSCELERMIEHFQKTEQLEDTYHCEKCKKQRNSNKKLQIWRLPNILVIHLKRFQYTRFRKEKLNNSISFPKILNLESVVESEDVSTRDSLYNLFGVVNHSGYLNGGHYTADCLSQNDYRWYRFNDSQFVETQVDYSGNGSQNPYILFYAKNSVFHK